MVCNKWSFIWKVFDRFQRRYQRSCANSSLSLLLVEVLFLLEKTAQAVNLLSLPTALCFAAHVRDNVVDSSLVLSASQSSQHHSHPAAGVGATGAAGGRMGRRDTVQLGSELILRSQPALVDYVLESVGFLLFWAKLEGHTLTLQLSQAEEQSPQAKTDKQHMQFFTDLTYRSSFCELLKLLFGVLAFLLRTSEHSPDLVLAVKGALHMFITQGHSSCMPDLTESPSSSPQSPSRSQTLSRFQVAVGLLGVAVEDSEPSEGPSPHAGSSSSLKIAQIICQVFQYIDLLSKRHIALNLYFSELLLSTFLHFGTIESEQLYPANSAVVFSYRLCVFTALYIVLFNSTKGQTESGTEGAEVGGGDSFTQEYLPLSIKYLFNTSVSQFANNSFLLLALDVGGFGLGSGERVCFVEDIRAASVGLAVCPAQHESERAVAGSCCDSLACRGE